MGKDKFFTPFVVFGASKSGTTWLQRLIDKHPECRCHFQTIICPFPKERRRKLNKYPIVYSGGQSPFKGIFKDEIEEKKYHWRNELLAQQEILKKDYVSDIANEQEKADYLSSYLKPIIKSVIRTILLDDEGDKKVYGTKAYTDLEQLLNIFPNAKIITIVRDGRDVVVSKRFHTLRMKVFFHGDEKYWLHRIWNKSFFLRKVLLKLNQKWSFLNENYFKKLDQPHDLLSMEALSKYSEQWVFVTEYIRSIQKKHPNNLLTVYYSKLYSQTEEELLKIFTFLGVDTVDEMLQKVIADSTLSRKGKNSFFRKGGSGDWKNYFSDAHKKKFKAIAGKMLIDLGFETDENW